MRWADLEGGDVLLSLKQAWLVLEADASAGPRRSIWLRWLDLRSGKVHAAMQDGARVRYDGEVLRGERVITLETWRLEQV